MFTPHQRFVFSTLLAVFICLLAMAASAQLPLINTVTVSPAGSVILNTGPTTQTFTITVPSGTTLGSIAALTLGAPNLDFTIVAAGTTCAAGTTGAACTVVVAFQPTAAGRRAEPS